MAGGVPAESSWDEFNNTFYEWRCRNGHIEVIFVSSAMDERLARSIWSVISSHKAGCSLRSLKLTTTGGVVISEGRSFPRSFFDIVHHLSRPYLLTR